MTGNDQHLSTDHVRHQEKPQGPSENSLVFVRHGEPDLTSSLTIFLGRVGPGLSPRGKAQADKVSLWARSFSWRGCFCSPLVRAKETAEIICSSLDIEPVIKEELSEIDLGCWDGREKTDIPREYPRLWEQREKDLYSFKHPGGESFADLEARVVPLLRSFAVKGGRWLIVSHAGVFRVMLRTLFEIPFPETFRYDPEYGGVLLLEKEGEAFLARGLQGLRIAWREPA
ncbi:MAG: histidine phosphatase family protein [Thermovirgaceae bacterium]|nr:histidine phosphatase family protein [Synergistales bacterium]MDI9393584.1 histidine phosphatase family protein [Synergistota bacterium]MDY0179078.1 histidine phosphatase family protein [Synergistaceae bacterium]HRW87018.1 histidine phosphatase family protein [Thermovirgaceae bacterium]MDD3830166.1 histidine phosphatase family protein [Synergistales bacterium]